MLLYVCPMTDEGALREFLQERFGVGIQQAVAIARGRGVLIIVVESEASDDVLGDSMETLRRAARDQLTGAAPGLLCAKLEGLTADELIALGTGRPSGSPSALAVSVNRLMESSSLDHVAWVVFLTDGRVERSGAGAWSRVGATFAFRNPRSPFKDDARLQLFHGS
jgi:hypothetical protein